MFLKKHHKTPNHHHHHHHQPTIFPHYHQSTNLIRHSPLDIFYHCVIAHLQQLTNFPGIYSQWGLEDKGL